MAKTSQIQINVELNDDNHPIGIEWKSDDNPSGTGLQSAKAMMLSLFDKEYKDTFKIDLWTEELQVIEMDRFVYQALKSMGDTYFKATNNTKLANDIQRFAQYFGEETETIKKEG